MTSDQRKQASAIITDGIKGAIIYGAFMVLIGLLLTSIAGTLLDRYRDRDSSDSVTARSGLGIRTDALTGCQYLESASGSLTPRIDSAGRPVCHMEAKHEQN